MRVYEDLLTMLTINKLYGDFFSKFDQELHSSDIFLDLTEAFVYVNYDILLQRIEIIFEVIGKSQEILKSFY